MLIEISLVQRLGLLLGEPALSFAIVFAGLLGAAGLGSRCALLLRSPRRASLIAIAASLAVAGLLGPAVTPFLGAPETVRIALALAIVIAVGFVLGMPFPLGLAAAARAGDQARTAWAFAVNALASIAAAVVALIFASEIGLSGVMSIAAACYAIAYASFARL